MATLHRIPAKVWLRLGLLGGLLAAGFALLAWTPLGDVFTEERMIALLGGLREAWWAPLLLAALYVAITPLGLPVTPLVIAGGMVFGPLLGAVYNTLGLLVAAMAGYYLADALGREFVVRFAGQRLRRAERIFARQGFWPLVQVRLLPIPFAVVSYGAALAGVKAPRLLLTSAIGLIPATTTHTYFAPALIRDPDWMTGLLYVVAMVALNLLAGWQTLRERLLRRERYRRILEERRTRPGGAGR